MQQPTASFSITVMSYSSAEASILAALTLSAKKTALGHDGLGNSLNKAKASSVFAHLDINLQ